MSTSVESTVDEHSLLVSVGVNRWGKAIGIHTAAQGVLRSRLGIETITDLEEFDICTEQIEGYPALRRIHERCTSLVNICISAPLH